MNSNTWSSLLVQRRMHAEVEFRKGGYNAIKVKNILPNNRYFQREQLAHSCPCAFLTTSGLRAFTFPLFLPLPADVTGRSSVLSNVIYLRMNFLALSFFSPTQKDFFLQYFHFFHSLEKGPHDRRRPSLTDL